MKYKKKLVKMALNVLCLLSTPLGLLYHQLCSPLCFNIDKMYCENKFGRLGGNSQSPLEGTPALELGVPASMESLPNLQTKQNLGQTRAGER